MNTYKGMHNPPHPGDILKSTLIEGMGLSITKAAERLGVSRTSLSILVNRRGGLSPEMAVRLSIVLNTSSELWLNLQTTYDLWQAEKSRQKLTKQLKEIRKAS